MRYRPPLIRLRPTRLLRVVAPTLTPRLFAGGSESTPPPRREIDPARASVATAKHEVVEPATAGAAAELAVPGLQRPATAGETLFERRIGFVVLALVLWVGAVLRAWLAVSDDGIYWPDEVYQSLEPAHRLVFGHGLVAWEFIEGARHWAFPGIVAGLLKISAIIGLDEPRGYLTLVKLTFSLVGVSTALGSYLLAKAYGASTLAAACGAALFALVAPAIYFAPRALSETASALPVVLGFALALRPGAGFQQRLFGASLLGLAVLIRLQNGVFCLGLLAIFAGRRQWRFAAEAYCVLLWWAILFGLIDKLTWGGWFHSAIVYLDFSVVEGKASQWGTAPFSYYLRVLWTSMDGAALLLAGLALCGVRRAPGLFLAALAFFMLHAATPHKEFRFILPALPLFCAVAAIGIDTLPVMAARLGRLRAAGSHRVRYAAAAAVVVAAVVSAASFHSLTFGEIGQYEDDPPGLKGYYKPEANAYDDFGAINRLLLAANKIEALCGLKIENVAPVWTGSYSYLHRAVPIYPPWGAGRESAHFNYVITDLGANPADSIVARESGHVLVYLGHDTCVPDPEYKEYLFRPEAGGDLAHAARALGPRASYAA
jgi:GPI mannosyltransferase 3